MPSSMIENGQQDRIRPSIENAGSDLHRAEKAAPPEKARPDLSIT